MSIGRASNDNGRSLEYLITKELASRSSCTLTSRALIDQSRDAETVRRIDERLIGSFEQAAQVSANWILKEVGIGAGKEFEVDRASDSDPGVADLIIKSGINELQLSVKHNHDALSHPRPYSLLKAVGFAGIAVELDHRRRLGVVSDEFRNSVDNAVLFSEVIQQKKKLYEDVCKECEKSIRHMGENQSFVKSLFTFLVSPGCQKLIVRTTSETKALQAIEVHDYRSIPLPTALKTSVVSRSNATSLNLAFDNNWIINLRIHNASSRISKHRQLSLKFDAQRANESAVPPFMVLL